MRGRRRKLETVERREEERGNVPWDVAAAFHLDGGRKRMERVGYLLVCYVASSLGPSSLPPSHVHAPPSFILTLASLQGKHVVPLGARG